MTIQENSIFYSHELSNEDYHADPAIGSSGIKSFKECPAIYYDNYIAPDREAYMGNKATRTGSHAHICLLEPDRFKDEFRVSDEFALVNKGKKNERQEPMNRRCGDWTTFEAQTEAQGKKAITFNEFKQASAMAEVIRRHPLASRMLIGGQSEMSFFARDTETGLILKARPDYLVKLDDFGIVLVDYKTTGISMATRKQSNNAFSLGRHIQASHHKTVAEMATGGEINHVVYITQMQERPYLIRFFRMPPHSIERGLGERRMYLNEMAECYGKNEWPGYPPEIEDYVEPGYLDYEFN